MSTPEDRVPKRFTQFLDQYPDIGKAYTELGDAVHNAGPLDNKTRALIKVAISGGARLEGGFHSHVRKAIQVGASKDELQHIALLALPTIGFPSMMALLTWIEDIYKDDKS